jgi:serine/threonine-protein kinase
MSDVLDAESRAAASRLGHVIGGRWTLEKLLGVGGMAAVYAATDGHGGRAALKILHPEMSRRADIRQRFAQEGTAASRVGHPGVVQVLGHGEDPDGTAYLVLELLEGEPLTAVVRRDQGLSLPRLLDVLDQVLDVLAAAHARGIVHRDLKPDNLFVATDGRVRVLDFGIARVLDDVPGAYKTRTGITLGTVPYMSPEQALGKRAQVDGRSDLFSLGAMTFRILAGRNVHEGETDAEMLVSMASKPAPPLATVAPGVPPALASIVDLSLAFSKESRYPDARTMQEDVRAVARGEAPPYATRIRSARETATRTDLPAPVIAVPAASRAVTVPEPTVTTAPAMRVAAASPAVTVPRPTATTAPAMRVAAASRAVTVPEPTATTAPAIALAAPSQAVTVPEATAETALDLEGVTRAPLHAPPMTAVPASVRHPEPLPPESRRVLAMPRVAPDLASAAPIVEKTAHAAPTAPMLAAPDQPTMVSSRPAVPAARTMVSAPPATRSRKPWIAAGLAGLAAAIAGVFLLLRGASAGAPSAPGDAVLAASSGAAPSPISAAASKPTDSTRPATSPASLAHSPAAVHASTSKEPVLAEATASAGAPSSAGATPTAPGPAPPPAAATASPKTAAPGRAQPSPHAPRNTLASTRGSKSKGSVRGRAAR